MNLRFIASVLKFITTHYPHNNDIKSIYNKQAKKTCTALQRV